jgi:Trk-type K+ transport system membrane component
MFEIIVGGIGFPLIFDFMEKIRYRKLKQKYRLTLFTKVAIVGFVIVTVAGLIFSYSLEYAYVDPVVIEGGGARPIYDVAHYVCNHHEFGKNEEFNKA